MSVNLENVLREIQGEKDTKLTANNLRYGVNCMGVQGGLKPVTIEGGDVGKQIYVQTETPVNTDGIWINTNKTITDIYLENEKYTDSLSNIFSNDNTSPEDPRNVIFGRNCPTSFYNSAYCQKGNVIHIFGHYSYTSSENVSPKINQHYKYDFDTNTWTKMSDCPTPWGAGVCEWAKDGYIYLLGSGHTDYSRYAYKYDPVNDEWTQLADLGIETYSYNYFLTSCYDGNNYIYIGCAQKIWRYDIRDNTVTFLTNSSSVSGSTLKTIYITDTNNKGSLLYYSGYIYNIGFGSSGYLGKYNISTNEWISTNMGLSTGYFYNCILIDNKIYGFIHQSSNSIAANRYYFIYNLSSNTRSEKSGNNSFALVSLNGIFPIAYFTTNTGIDIIMSFGGVKDAGGATQDPLRTAALTLDQKTYTLENDTIILYTTTYGQGKYAAQIYRDVNVVNGGKILNWFNNIDVYDATQNKLIQNLSTYYGDGTQWIKLK